MGTTKNNLYQFEKNKDVANGSSQDSGVKYKPMFKDSSPEVPATDDAVYMNFYSKYHADRNEYNRANGIKPDVPSHLDMDRELR